MSEEIKDQQMESTIEAESLEQAEEETGQLLGAESEFDAEEEEEDEDLIIHDADAEDALEAARPARQCRA